MQPYQHKHQLHITKSGIVFRVPADEPERLNLLIKNMRTGQVLLNGQTISTALYNSITERIWNQFPGCCIIANAYNIVFTYPKIQAPHTWQ